MTVSAKEILAQNDNKGTNTALILERMDTVERHYYPQSERNFPLEENVYALKDSNV